jgi:hypothetical protein
MEGAFRDDCLDWDKQSEVEVDDGLGQHGDLYSYQE